MAAPNPNLATIVDAELDLDSQVLFTCLSCSIAFLSAEEQRVHYRSDHHRYNMKRRVASLPPVSAHTFNQKVMDRRAETAVMLSPKGSTCTTCSKVYTTDGAYQNHIASKKHKENEIKAAAKRKLEPVSAPAEVSDTVPSYDPEEEAREAEEAAASGSAAPVEVESALEAAEAADEVAELPQESSEEEEEGEEGEEDVNQTIDQKIAAARSRLSSSHCLFCSHESNELAENLTHMSSVHSFFIPDADYLTDLTGLINYLGEKVAVGNVCLSCNGKGRDFRTIDAVRKHMISKSHCKIAYDSENDRLEISDYYDFSTSYPDAELKRRANKTKKIKAAKAAAMVEQDEWEDEDDDGSDADEVVDDSASESDSDSDSDDLPENQIRFGDTNLELVLPSGARLGHRSLRRYYAQSFPGAKYGKPEDPNSGAALVRRLLADRNSALIPVAGAFGAFGRGTEVIKARNRGEARDAGRHVREFRDMKRRENFKTKIGFINNSQKHFRDPLLQ